jgi:prepilin-type processing-associated H-X9-DG protein
LLVVVAIAGLLASLLLPGLGTARDAARRTECASNLRQWAAAWFLYAGDSDDRATPSYYVLDRGRTVASWDFTVHRQSPPVVTLGLLGPYTRSVRLGQCPSFSGEAWGRPATGYAYNTTYLGGDPAMGTGPVALSSVADPGATVLFADAGFGSPVRGHNYLRAPSDPLFVAGLVHFRHQGSANVAWADGRFGATRRVYRPDPDEPTLGALSHGDEAYDLD